MSRSTLPWKTFAAAVLAFAVAAFAPGSAFAQRGGGHAGGGFGGGHMGGGGFGGGHAGGFGGSHASGGSHSSASAHAAPRAHSAPASTPAPAVHPASSAAASPAGNAVVHAPNFAPRPSTGALGSGAFVLRSESAPSHHTVIGFPPSESRIATGDPEFRPGSGALSFSGQGRAIWQDAPAARAGAGKPAPESQRILFGRPEGTRIVRHPVPPHRVFSPPTAVPVLFFPAFGFYPFGLFGNGFCDPFWGFDPAFGCDAFGYGYGAGFGYGGGYPGFGGYGSASDNSFNLGLSSGPQVYSNDDASDDAAGDSGTFSPAPSLEQGAAPEGGAAPSAPAPPSASTAIFLKDGTSFAVLSYWLDSGKLHYITNYGGESALDMSQLDLQRTVDENARTGVAFTLKPAAPVAPPAPAPQP